MHPELIENATFLRYYEKWQGDSTSVVFAAISEIFRGYGMLDEAIQIALQGLKHHPNLVSGHLALAKAYLAKGEKDKARGEAVFVLGIMPNNEEAKRIFKTDGTELLSYHTTMLEDEITEEMPLDAIDGSEEKAVSDHEAWHTVTMARILVSQGHIERARAVYEKILEKEPLNEEVKSEMSRLTT